MSTSLFYFLNIIKSIIISCKGPINSIAMSRDEQCLLASSLDSTIRLFDKQTGELLNEYINSISIDHLFHVNAFRYTSHKNEEFKVDCCFNNFDTHIICGSEDGNVYIWDLVKVNKF